MFIPDRRTKFRAGLSPHYRLQYDNLCALLPACWQPYQGFRDFKSQDELYAKGRTEEGHIVTHARGGESAHNYGCASDWAIFVEGKPIWIDKTDPRWEHYVHAVQLVGLRPGQEFGDVDHNELKISKNWKEIFEYYKSHGMDATQDYIASLQILSED